MPDFKCAIQFCGSASAMHRASSARPRCTRFFMIPRLQQNVFIAGLPDDCIADFNDDGNVASDDFFSYLEAFFALDPSADHNADSIVDSRDFFIFIESFLTAC